MTLPDYIATTFKPGLMPQLQRRFPKADVAKLASQVYEQHLKSPLRDPNAYLFVICRGEHEKAGGEDTTPRRSTPTADASSQPQLFPDLGTEKALTDVLIEAALVAGTGGPPEAAALLVYSRVSQFAGAPRLAEFARKYAQFLSDCATWEEVQLRLDQRRAGDAPF
jgi:hypothetical protein